MSETDRMIRMRCPNCGTEYLPGPPGTCGQNEPFVCREELEPVYAPTAQDVVDALRLVLMQDETDVRLVRALVDHAPATNSQRGVAVLLDLIRTGQATVTLV